VRQGEARRAEDLNLIAPCQVSQIHRIESRVNEGLMIHVDGEVEYRVRVDIIL
jgi:hypothetical protein